MQHTQVPQLAQKTPWTFVVRTGLGYCMGLPRARSRLVHLPVKQASVFTAMQARITGHRLGWVTEGVRSFSLGLQLPTWMQGTLHVASLSSGGSVAGGDCRIQACLHPLASPKFPVSFLNTTTARYIPSLHVAFFRPW